jgi:sorbitol-specific phosphotransferase system component IIBC
MWILSLAIAVAAAWFGHSRARRFVASRLRYVDRAQSPLAPWIAGAGVMLLASPVALLLPVVGAGAVLSLGIGVGTGVAAGARAIRLAAYKIPY